MDLRNTQHWVRDQIKIRNRLIDGVNAQDLSQIFTTPQGGTLEERFDAYVGGYPSRMFEGMGEMYEAIHSLLGDDRFFDLTMNYMKHYPSRTADLGQVGAHLPEFLEKSELADRFPFLPDLARLERFVSESFHSTEEPAWDPEDLAGIPAEEWDSLVLPIQPYVRTVISQWPIYSLWIQRLEPDSVDAPDLKASESILLSRQEFAVQCFPASPLEVRALRLLQQGKTIGAMADALAQDATTAKELSESLFIWFKTWAERGVFAKLKR